MRWYQRDDVVDYVCKCYAGVDQGRRQFIWEDENGDVLIGNTRAFTEHCGAKFGVEVTKTAWMRIHDLLRALGEVVHVVQHDGSRAGQKFRNQEPKSHVLRRRKVEDDY